jgi:hypothetical protein
MRRLMAVAVATHLLAVSHYALAKGGYVRAPGPVPVVSMMVHKPPKMSIHSPKHLLGGCGRGAIRDPQTHKCRGPGNIGQ